MKINILTKKPHKQRLTNQDLQAPYPNDIVISASACLHYHLRPDQVLHFPTCRQQVLVLEHPKKINGQAHTAILLQEIYATHYIYIYIYE